MLRSEKHSAEQKPHVSGTSGPLLAVFTLRRSPRHAWSKGQSKGAEREAGKERLEAAIDEREKERWS